MVRNRRTARRIWSLLKGTLLFCAMFSGFLGCWAVRGTLRQMRLGPERTTDWPRDPPQGGTQLSGTVPLNVEASYLGGWCFGHVDPELDTHPVGEAWLTANVTASVVTTLVQHIGIKALFGPNDEALKLKATDQLPMDLPHLRIFVFDDEQAQWQSAKTRLNSTSCEDLDRITHLSLAIPLYPGMYRKQVGFKERIGRHWFAVGVGCNLHKLPAWALRDRSMFISYRLFLENELASWGPEVWQPLECPSQPFQAVRETVLRWASKM